MRFKIKYVFIVIFTRNGKPYKAGILKIIRIKNPWEGILEIVRIL